MAESGAACSVCGGAEAKMLGKKKGESQRNEQRQPHSHNLHTGGAKVGDPSHLIGRPGRHLRVTRFPTRRVVHDESALHNSSREKGHSRVDPRASWSAPPPVIQFGLPRNMAGPLLLYSHDTNLIPTVPGATPLRSNAVDGE